MKKFDKTLLLKKKVNELHISKELKRYIETFHNRDKAKIPTLEEMFRYEKVPFNMEDHPLFFRELVRVLMLRYGFSYKTDWVILDPKSKLLWLGERLHYWSVEAKLALNDRIISLQEIWVKEARTHNELPTSAKAFLSLN